MTTAITKIRGCVASITPAISILGLVLLLTACTNNVENEADSSSTKFTVPGGDQMLRAVEVSSIQARYTLSVVGQEPTAAIAMSRVGTSNQWETPQITIPPNTGFTFELVWFAAGIDGIAVQYASQTFDLVVGVNLNRVFDISKVPYVVENFDNDGDGANNYQELLNGTSPVVFDENITDTGTLDMGVMEDTANPGTADTSTVDTGTVDTSTVDTGTADTGTADTGTADTGTADTGTVDTGTVDNGTADSGAADTGAVDTGTADSGMADAGSTDGGVITPSGTIAGVWFGNNNHGEGVMIVDVNENIFALSANGSGQYETVFGPASGTLERFFHSDSDNPAFADSFTLFGDSPSDTDTNISDTITYNLSVENDGQQINHTGEGGDFSMTFATENDVSSVSLDSVAGDWISKSSICAEDCNLTLEMTIANTGDVVGFTQFNEFQSVPMSGTASLAETSTQYLNIEFLWDNSSLTGVIYVDRLDPTRLILNTFGPDESTRGVGSFTASMIRR